MDVEHGCISCIRLFQGVRVLVFDNSLNEKPPVTGILYSMTVYTTYGQPLALIHFKLVIVMLLIKLFILCKALYQSIIALYYK